MPVKVELVIVAAGIGLGLVFNFLSCAGVNFSTCWFPVVTHRFRDLSNATPLEPPDIMSCSGAGIPLFASCLGVNDSTQQNVAFQRFAHHAADQVTPISVTHPRVTIQHWRLALRLVRHIGDPQYRLSESRRIVQFQPRRGFPPSLSLPKVQSDRKARQLPAGQKARFMPGVPNQ
jgi:hypothetical protein